MSRPDRSGKSAMLELRLTPTQKAALKAMADRQQCTVSEMVRDIIEESLAREADLAPLMRVLRESPPVARKRVMR